MKRFLVFLASMLAAFVAISSTANATPADWTRITLTTEAAGVVGSEDGFALLPSWATAPTPGLMAFVSVQL